MKHLIVILAVATLTSTASAQSYRRRSTGMDGYNVHMSIADQEDLIDAAIMSGQIPASAFLAAADGPAGLGLEQGGPNLSVDVSRRLQRGVPASMQYRDPRTWIKPIHHPPSPPAYTRYYRSPAGDVLPHYLIPKNQMGRYKFQSATR